MKTNPSPGDSSICQTFLITRLWPACCLVISLLLTPARAANTFVNTGALFNGRTSHTATLLQNGKVLVAGGGNASYLASAELYDPATGAWSATGSLATARLDHTATMLPNGKVLVAGGSDGGAIFTSAEIYDPVAGTWSATGSLATARAVHTATLLGNGKVLVAGGVGDSGTLASAEIYDPGTGNWSVTGTLATARFLHTATLLPNGKVLVAGGLNGGTYLATAQFYDPGTGNWAATGSFTTARYSHTTTLLPNGKVLLAGGTSSSGNLGTAHIYDPAGNGGVGSWTATGNLATARADHTASLLPNGKVLVAGGSGSSAELFDPAGNAGAGSWTATGALAAARADHTATLLPSGRVLVAGGKFSTTTLASAELYDSGIGTWSATNSLVIARSDHTATLLPNGKVLVAGGYYYDFMDHYLTSVRLYDPTDGTWSDTGPLTTARSDHTATLLPTGKVLVTGGVNASGALASSELYDPASGTWNATGNLAEARQRHTATLLPTGNVLVVWGQTGAPIPLYVATAEIYEPATGLWSFASTPSGGERIHHTATLLPNGKVLIGGGVTYFGTGGWVLYDPATNTWSGGDFSGGAVREDHTATLLSNGKVLVAGGSPNTGNVLFDPAINTWSGAGAFAGARYDHTATLLSSGKVLVTGGSGPVTSELYDPATGAWTATGAPTTWHRHHTATLLLNGKVLVAGDTTSGGLVAELFDSGLGFSAAWQPQISSASFDATGKLVLTGTGFRGSGAQDSLTNIPFVQLRRLDNEHSVFLLPDPAATVSASAFTSVPVAPFSGYARVTVFANGIPSAAFVTFFPTPDIGVFQPVNTGIPDGGTLGFGPMFVGSPAASLTFTIRNPLTDNLTGLTIIKDGANAGDFTVTASPTAPVAPGGSTTFTIQFAPTTSGTKTAAVHIANNVAWKNPYDINLTGQAYSFTQDTDGDGLNDATEFQMSTLGFDWQVSQPALVNTLFSNASGAGLFTAAQVQSLHAGAQFIPRNPATGQFKLEIGLEKSADLTNFARFPFLGPQTSVNGAGRIEFLFTAPDNAAFFLLRPQ